MDLLDRALTFLLDFAISYGILLLLSRGDASPTEVYEEAAENSVWVQPEPKTNPGHQTLLLGGLTRRQTCKLATHIQQGKPLTFRAIKKATGISEDKWRTARLALVGRGMAHYGNRETLVLNPDWRNWILAQLAPTAPQNAEPMLSEPPDRQPGDRQPKQTTVGEWVILKEGWEP